MITMDKTFRGFAIGEFEDRYGVKCSIQDSSIATEDCIWLGPTDPNPKKLVPGMGWQPAEIPPGVECTTRMHLSIEQCVELVEILNRFIETGSIAENVETIQCGSCGEITNKPFDGLCEECGGSVDPA